MAERVIIWLLFGVALALTPLLIVAVIGWFPATGAKGFVALLCNEDLLAVALNLGGAAAADVLTSREPGLRLAKLVVGGITFLATLISMGLYVAIKTRVHHLAPDEIVATILGAGGLTVGCALICQVLSGGKE